MQRRFRLGKVDELSLAGTGAVVQRGKNAGANELGRDLIRIGEKGTGWRAIPPPGQFVEPGYSRSHRPIAREGCFWARPSAQAGA